MKNTTKKGFLTHERSLYFCFIFTVVIHGLILSNLPLTRKSEKNVYFSILIKSNCQVPNSFFGITVNFIIQKLKLCKIEKEA